MAKTRNMARKKREARRSWHRFPNEIREMILHTALVDARANKHTVNEPASTTTPSNDIGSMASVCLEWQEFFERHTFRQLVLNQSNLRKFRDIMERTPFRLSYLRYILLHIQLPEYACDECWWPERQSTIEINNKIFSSQIRRLLLALSLWRPRRHGFVRHIPGGLTLEIAISSPSDNEHMFFTEALDHDYPFRTEEDLDKTSLSMAEYHREAQAINFQRAWHIAQTGGERSGGLRLYGTPLLLRPTVPVLPRAPIVKGLILPHYAYRSIEVRSLAQLLRQSLIALKWFRFEGPRAIEATYEEKFNKAFLKNLIPVLPSTLQRLTLSHHAIHEHHLISRPLPINRVDLANTIVYNRRFRNQLSEFSASNQMSVTAFLIRLQSEPPKVEGRAIPTTGYSLRLLCLQSHEFSSPTSTTEMIEHVITLSAGATPNLPNLQVMEIWGSSSEGFAHLFRYKIDQFQPTITWRCGGLREFSLSRSVVECWTKVVDKVHPGLVPLKIKEHEFPESLKEIQVTRGRFIHKHLELRRLVFDAVAFAYSEVEIERCMRLHQLPYKMVSY